MKFSEYWLREWVNPPICTEKLSEQITMAGLEVDSIKAVAGAFHGVVVGEIVECDQHLISANNLRTTKVNIGSNRLLDIVCSAPNCHKGLRVAVATTSTVLPDDFKTKLARMCSEPSDGMLCSLSELGISEDYTGIIELPHDAPIGADIREYLWLDDNVIEISVTPNRADCLSIIGMARDVAVMNQLPLTVPEITPITATLTDTFPIHVESPEACPRYLGLVIKGIDVEAATPLWMRKKLLRCGIRSINAVVDVTNYVLMELGQPMHVFDLDCLDGGIVVRLAQEGETLRLLDGNKATLNLDTLVIADHSKVLAMGGIFGGEHSAINRKTCNVLLECAYFNPLAIIGRARRHGLHTDASHRYERGVDPALQYKAMERAKQLLLAICGGQYGPVVDVTSEAHLPLRAAIILRREKLDRLIGHVIPDEKVSDILNRLGCNVIRTNIGWKTIAPSWRFDMEIEEDLVEEVARVYGYNNIPNIPIHGSLTTTPHCEADLSLKRIKTLLIDRGYHEAITYSFVDPKVQSLIHPDKEALILSSPISIEMSAMRLSLLSGLLGAIVYNKNRQQSRLRLFESGLRFVPDSQDKLIVRQDLMLACVITGNRYDEHWDLPRQMVDFYDLKGDLESLLSLTGKSSEIAFKAKPHPALHPGQSATIYLSGEPIGFIGIIHPEVERKLDLNGRTVVFELSWNKVADRVVPEASEISRYPSNRRDIAVVVAENVLASEVLSECKKAILNQLFIVNLFDVYRGKGIKKGYKSLAISLVLQDTSRTLVEEEIAATVSRCVGALKQRFQASLRN
ncbi:MAG: phenylalanine--tRNA ligase subunit beta [Candidatus Malihini olakiniferum]